MSKIEKNLLKLINIAKALSLSQEDIEQSLQFLKHHEYGLSFDHIVTQLYEYDIEITHPIYQLIEEIGVQLTLHSRNYSYIKEMIRDENEISFQVANKISIIIQSLANNV